MIVYLRVDVQVCTKTKVSSDRSALIGQLSWADFGGAGT